LAHYNPGILRYTAEKNYLGNWPNEHESFLGLVHTMPEEFENTALFLAFGLPSTLIHHENGAFLVFRFGVGGKHFENEALRKRWHVISLTEFSSNTNPK